MPRPSPCLCPGPCACWERNLLPDFLVRFGIRRLLEGEAGGGEPGQPRSAATAPDEAHRAAAQQPHRHQYVRGESAALRTALRVLRTRARPAAQVLVGLLPRTSPKPWKRSGREHAEAPRPSGRVCRTGIESSNWAVRLGLAVAMDGESITPVRTSPRYPIRARRRPSSIRSHGGARPEKPRGAHLRCQSAVICLRQFGSIAWSPSRCSNTCATTSR